MITGEIAKAEFETYLDDAVFGSLYKISSGLSKGSLLPVAVSKEFAQENKKILLRADYYRKSERDSMHKLSVDFGEWAGYFLTKINRFVENVDYLLSSQVVFSAVWSLRMHDEKRIPSVQDVSNFYDPGAVRMMLFYILENIGLNVVTDENNESFIKMQKNISAYRVKHSQDFFFTPERHSNFDTFVSPENALKRYISHMNYVGFNSPRFVLKDSSIRSNKINDMLYLTGKKIIWLESKK